MEHNLFYIWAQIKCPLLEVKLSLNTGIYKYILYNIAYMR